jgi:hypothetical protein
MELREQQVLGSSAYHSDTHPSTFHLLHANARTIRPAAAKVFVYLLTARAETN